MGEVREEYTDDLCREMIREAVGVAGGVAQQRYQGRVGFLLRERRDRSCNEDECRQYCHQPQEFHPDSPDNLFAQGFRSV